MTSIADLRFEICSALLFKLKKGTLPWLGLSTSCSRFPKKFPVISQKVAQRKKKHSFCCSLPLLVLIPVPGPMEKYANCTTKVRFPTIFVQFFGVTSVTK